MQTFTTITSLRHTIRHWRQNGERIAFVPTMGNLHEGHLTLVKAAQALADRVVVSIFVNPTQFGPNEDFASYPRTEVQDTEKLQSIHADALFLPSVAEMYPAPLLTSIAVSELSTLHCGAYRPGHFDGVALVVCKLLNIVQPDCLLLGEKDFQQLAIVRRMIDDLNLPVEVVGVPTVREADGLAMSSRNGYLSPEERQKAASLYTTLCAARDTIQADQSSDDDIIIADRVTQLNSAGFTVDYLHLCCRETLLPARPDDQDLIILAAARLGKTRLIDNLYFRRTLSIHSPALN